MKAWKDGEILFFFKIKASQAQVYDKLVVE